MKHLALAIALIFSNASSFANEWYSGKGTDPKGVLTCFVSIVSDDPDMRDRNRSKPIISLWIRSFHPTITEFSVMTFSKQNIHKNATLVINGKSYPILMRNGDGWLEKPHQETDVFKVLNESKLIEFHFTIGDIMLVDKYFPNGFETAIVQLSNRCTSKS